MKRITFIATLAVSTLAIANTPLKPTAPDGWQPSVVQTQQWDPGSGSWQTTSTIHYTYTDFCKLSAEWNDTFGEKTEYIYNDRQQLVEKVSSRTRTTYEYDALVPSVAVNVKSFTLGHSIEDLARAVVWVPSGSDITTITRDSNNNVTRSTQVRTSIFSSPQEFCEFDYEIEYGNNGKANKFNMYKDGKIMVSLNDIVWDCTDGQFVQFIYFSYSETLPQYSNNFFSGNNRIKSATISRYPGFDAPLYLTATYGDNGSYAFKVKYKNETISDCRVTYTDSNGSYEYSTDYISTPEQGSEKEAVHNVVTYDKYGLMLTWDYKAWTGGSLNAENSSTSTVHYDSLGRPTDYFDGTFRTLYLDYVAGVDNIISEENEAPEYFDLHGNKVATPSKGLYIVQKGSSIKKVLFR